jgi:hypothetical protein
MKARPPHLLRHYQKALLSLLKACALSLTMLLLNNCGDGTTPVVDPTFSSLYTNFFYNNCLQCHQPGGSGTTAGATLNFTDANTAYSSLKNSTSGGFTSGNDCEGISLVNTTTPANSFLLAILSSEDSSSNFAGRSGCTPYTEHHTNTAIRQAYSSNVRQALTQWISAGAPNN